MTFEQSRDKIERAKKHIYDFKTFLLSDSIQGNLYSIAVETDRETGCDFLKFILSPRVPSELMCIVGDALHNLRTALDFAANDLEFSTTGQRTKYTKFPIGESRDGLMDAINGGFKDKAPGGVIDFIVDVIQPYKGGNGNSIWGLNALDIEDKHRMLIPNLQWKWIRNVRYKDESEEIFTVPEWAATGESIPDFFTARRSVNVTNKGNCTVSIVFGQGLPFSGKHISLCLNNLEKFVSGALIGIESVLREE